MWKRVMPPVCWNIFYRNKWKRISYSQAGEDLILENLIDFLGISPVTYLEAVPIG